MHLYIFFDEQVQSALSADDYFLQWIYFTMYLNRAVPKDETRFFFHQLRARGQQRKTTRKQENYSEIPSRPSFPFSLYLIRKEKREEYVMLCYSGRKKSLWVVVIVDTVQFSSVPPLLDKFMSMCKYKSVFWGKKSVSRVGAFYFYVVHYVCLCYILGGIFCRLIRY